MNPGIPDTSRSFRPKRSAKPTRKRKKPKVPSPSVRGHEDDPRQERRLQVHRAIQSGSFPNKNSLAKLLRVHPETIQGDFEYWRRMGMPLEYNPARKGFFYTEAVPDLPSAPITQKEIGALATVEEFAKQLPGTELAKHLGSMGRKMRRAFNRDFSYTVSDVGKHFSIRYTAESIVDGKIMDALCRAIIDGEQLELEYRKPGEKAYKKRLLDGYHLAGVNGEWFFFAHDYERNDVRRFAPIHMRNIRPTGVRFQRPADFDVETYLENSFGIHSAEGVYEVILRTDANAADFIREKRWRGQTKQVELPCGGVELHLTLSSLAEIERFVLSYRGDIVVLAPFELQERCLRSAEKFVCRQRILAAEQGNHSAKF